MVACHRCALARGRHHVVLYRGAKEPWLLFVGEAPGKEEDLTGTPFVGRSGRILDAAALEHGLRPEDWGVTNTVMCRPPANRFDRVAAAACRPWLELKLAHWHPRLIVTLGRHALEAFLPNALPVLSSAGALRSWHGTPLYPMLHPAATLHSRVYGDRWRADWARLQGYLREGRFAAAPTPASNA